MVLNGKQQREIARLISPQSWEWLKQSGQHTKMWKEGGITKSRAEAPIIPVGMVKNNFETLGVGWGKDRHGGL